MRRLRSRTRFQQRGIAALTAILVVAMATILAVELAWDLNLDIRRTENLLLHAQARQFALGAELMAADALRTDYENDIEDGGACDYLEEDWNTELALPFEGGSVRGRLTDLQGRFNLNNLIIEGQKNEAAYDQFVRLLEILGLDPRLGAKVLDWIDPDQVAGPLYAAFEHGRHAQFVADLTDALARIQPLHRCARDDFEISHFG